MTDPVTLNSPKVPSTQTPPQSTVVQNVFNATVKNEAGGTVRPLSGGGPPSIENLHTRIEEAAGKIAEAGAYEKSNDSALSKAMFALLADAQTLLLNTYTLIDAVKSTQSKLDLFEKIRVQLLKYNEVYCSWHFLFQDNSVITEKRKDCWEKIKRLHVLVRPNNIEKYFKIRQLISDTFFLEIPDPNNQKIRVNTSLESLEDIFTFVDSTECTLVPELKCALFARLLEAFLSQKKNASSCGITLDELTLQHIEICKQKQAIQPETSPRIVTPRKNDPDRPGLRTAVRLAILAFIGYLAFSFCRRVYVRLTR